MNAARFGGLLSKDWRFKKRRQPNKWRQFIFEHFEYGMEKSPKKPRYIRRVFHTKGAPRRVQMLKQMAAMLLNDSAASAK